MIEVKGKANIVARIIADSISEQGHRLTTWEVEYPRLIHSELMTHRMFSRNAASSRAIPFSKMLEQLNGEPVRFGANQSGMQDCGEDFHSEQLGYYGKNQNGDDEWLKLTPYAAWCAARLDAVVHAQRFHNAGYHKQITGRLTEPFQMMKTVITATEVANFFWLRNDKAADPTIAELARCMEDSYEQSQPTILTAGQYHLPYIDVEYTGVGDKQQIYFIQNEDGISQAISLENAIKVSCARCAAVSYRNEGYGLEKSLEVYERLLGSDKKHASAFEHVASPMQLQFHDYLSRPIIGINDPMDSDTWQPGISHADRDGHLWSGNFKGWIQYRKTIDGENYIG